MRNLIGMILDRTTRDPGGRAYLVKGADRRWRPVTWSELAARTERFAAGLLAAGLATGDRVAILGHTRLEWSLCDLATLRAGGVSVGIYQTLSGEQAAYILADSGATVLCVETEPR